MLSVLPFSIWKFSSRFFYAYFFFFFNYYLFIYLFFGCPYSNILFAGTLHLCLYAKHLIFKSEASFGGRSWLERKVAGKRGCAADPTTRNKPRAHPLSSERAHPPAFHKAHLALFTRCPLAHSRGCVSIC
uniref:Uncharacterized protein n=1 Tax=Balaenoptera musculus TaxID=9771 RepID=A0A8C0E217_BALMU